MKTDKNVLARSKGFIVGIPDEVYEKRISAFNYLYIEREDKLFVLYRMDHKTNKIRVLINNVEFERAIEKAE